MRAFRPLPFAEEMIRYRRNDPYSPTGESVKYVPATPTVRSTPTAVPRQFNLADSPVARACATPGSFLGSSMREHSVLSSASHSPALKHATPMATPSVRGSPLSSGRASANQTPVPAPTNAVISVPQLYMMPVTTTFARSAAEPTTMAPVQQPLLQQLHKAANTAATAPEAFTPEALQALVLGHDALDVRAPAGVAISVYSADMMYHYTVPSGLLFVTDGLQTYAAHHRRYGCKMRQRFQLCKDFMSQARGSATGHGCARHSGCRFLHVGAAELRAVCGEGTMVHLNPFAPRALAAQHHANGGHGGDAAAPATIKSTDAGSLHFVDDPAIVERYAHLPRGITIAVFPPHGDSPVEAARAPQRVRSEKILETVGSREALSAALAPNRVGAVRMRPRHCAHYQFKRICDRGPACRFIHSTVPYIANEGTNPTTNNAAACCNHP